MAAAVYLKTSPRWLAPYKCKVVDLQDALASHISAEKLDILLQ
jgi:hypothetical protein